jgi:hypothetical protein
MFLNLFSADTLTKSTRFGVALDNPSVKILQQFGVEQNAEAQSLNRSISRHNL